MARRARQRPSGHEIGPARAQEFEEYVAKLLEEAGFKVALTAVREDAGFDMVVEGQGIAGTSRIAVEVKANRSPITADAVHQLAGIVAADRTLSTAVLIANSFTKSARHAVEKQPRIRLYTLDEFEKALEEAQISPRPRPQLLARQVRTVVGRAVLANREQIIVTAAALKLLIDERIRSLRVERPNSYEAQSHRDEMVERYEKLKRDVEALAEVAAAFKKDRKKEPEVVKTSKTFAEGVRDWWTKGHDSILNKTMDMSMFLSAVGICAMAGAGGTTSVLVSGALIGGKPAAGVLKEIAKHAFKRD